jgi:hypothetical protein
MMDDEIPWLSIAAACAWVMAIFGLVGLIVARIVGG